MKFTPYPFAFLFLISLIYCSKKETDPKTDALAATVSSDASIPDVPVLNFTESNEGGKSSPEKANTSSTEPSILMTASPCGGSFGRSRSGSGYYIYPPDTIDASGVVEGSSISISLDAGATPNRFSILTRTGVLVAASPWLGVASYSGPWGASVNQRYGTLTFTRGSENVYRFKVETVGNGTVTYYDDYQAVMACNSPSAITRTYAGVTITFYASTGMLKFNTEANLATVLDQLETDYEAYNTNYENQYPNYTTDQLDDQDSILNFNQFLPLQNFENLFPGFSSKRKQLYDLETNWLNTVTDVTDANNPDSLDYSSDFITNAIANVYNKFIVGNNTIEYRHSGLYKNGARWDDDELAQSLLVAPTAIDGGFITFALCNICDTCRNWQRESKLSFPWADDRGRTWKFEKIIAIRGISGDGRGRTKATIKAYRKVGSKFKRKRAWLGLKMEGLIWSNAKCITPRDFNSGVYSSARQRNFMRRKYAPAGSRFFRTKKSKVVGTYTIDPKGNGTPYGETQYLVW